MEIYFEEEWNEPESAFNWLSAYSQFQLMGVFDDGDAFQKREEIESEFKARFYRGLFGMSNVVRDGVITGIHRAIMESSKPSENPISVKFGEKTPESILSLKDTFFRKDEDIETTLRKSLDSYATFASAFPKMRSDTVKEIFAGYVIGHAFAQKEFYPN